MCDKPMYFNYFVNIFPCLFHLYRGKIFCRTTTLPSPIHTKSYLENKRFFFSKTCSIHSMYLNRPGVLKWGASGSNPAWQPVMFGLRSTSKYTETYRKVISIGPVSVCELSLALHGPPGTYYPGSEFWKTIGFQCLFCFIIRLYFLKCFKHFKTFNTYEKFFGYILMLNCLNN